METIRDPAARKGEILVPDRAPTSRCTCGATMVWVHTARGKTMPLSAATLRMDGQGHRFALSHFADCPNAKGYRKPGVPKQVSYQAITLDLRDLSDYHREHADLAVVGSTLSDDGKSRLIIELQTRRLA